MLRDKNLIPLSHQHQHALALCVRIDRASPISDGDVDSWQSEIAQLWQSEIEIHFAAEERVLFPTARKFPELGSLVDELLADHARLRISFSDATANKMSGADLRVFASNLSAHIRKEERQLFEQMQKLIDPKELALFGQQLEEALKDAVQACALPAKPSSATIKKSY
jgi:hemerythrin-like domain-containing protein